jgi:hypothetical protein
VAVRQLDVNFIRERERERGHGASLSIGLFESSIGLFG